MEIIHSFSEALTTDFLVVGAGIAGLRAAITLAEAGEVLVLAKDSLQESSSQYAQGGIAVALSDDDEVRLHEEDTLAAGDGLCNREAVRTLVEEAPAAIQQLIDWGTEFDREGARLLFAREGAHSRSRVLHAHGDSTGQEIVRSLQVRAVGNAHIRMESYAAVTDLLCAGGEVAGALAYESRTHQMVAIRARAVLLASGGLGRVYEETTNPEVATGDGVAMAWRAGAEISDIEFVQFHPTALHVEGAPRFLLSEALRGEGAYLRNAAGERFVDELAPRDVVSRAIVAELERTRANHVFLDLTHLEKISQRFPRIYSTCRHYGIDLAVEQAPVHPAAHYAMGGVYTDLNGQTSLERLYAAGEVACTGVHGANRLASNSLLEGVVFGARAAESMKRWMLERPPGDAEAPALLVPLDEELALRRLAWRYAGLVREGDGLREAMKKLEAIPMREQKTAARAEFERRNLHAVTMLIARCAHAREESRGGHYRSDFPGKRADFEKHSLVKHNSEVTFF